MTRTKSILGAMLLSALAVCALGAVNASALTGHECKQGGGGTGIHYTDSTCSVEGKEGTFELVPDAGEHEIENTITPTTAGMNVTEGETEGTHGVLHGTLAGVSYQITCGSASSPGAIGKNSEVGGVMTITGTGTARYTECKMAKPTQCTVPATIETAKLTLTTEEDKIILNAPENKFVVLEVGGASCPAVLKGKKIIEGVARGSVVSPTSIEYTSTSGSALTFGGQACSFTIVTHVKTKGTETPGFVSTP